MIIVPNSCFSVLFVDTDLFKIESNATIDLSTDGIYGDKGPEPHVPQIASGIWIPLNYSFRHVEGMSDSESVINVKVTTFATNERFSDWATEGFMGISPCHPVLKDYSFAYQLGLLQEDQSQIPIGGIKTLKWNMTSADNDDLT